MNDVLRWMTLFFDAAGIVASIAAVVIYIVLYRRLAKAASTAVTVPVEALRSWLAVNAILALLVGLNMVRWFILTDLYPLLGRTQGDTAVDALSWAVCDLLLVLMPLILIGKVAVPSDKGNSHG